VSDGAHLSLWIRSVDSLTAQRLPGTDDASFPFWSPDSRWIAFFAHDKLMKIETGGGPAQTLCEAIAGRGGAWTRDGVIVFGTELPEKGRFPAEIVSPRMISLVPGSCHFGQR
jgi:hypothetical protein